MTNQNRYWEVDVLADVPVRGFIKRLGNRYQAVVTDDDHQRDLGYHGRRYEAELALLAAHAPCAGCGKQVDNQYYHCFGCGTIVCVACDRQPEDEVGVPHVTSAHFPPAPAKTDTPDPIAMLLWCPECGARHIDEGEFATRSHHSHACQSCGMVWRPAIVPTCGVQFLPGFGPEDVTL